MGTNIDLDIDMNIGTCTHNNIDIDIISTIETEPSIHIKPHDIMT